MASPVPDMAQARDLQFDRKNPRLVEMDITDSTSDDQIVQVLWDAMDVEELVLSIAASGFFQHEPLIVAREGGQQVVIEGNRRLAAVRVLLGTELADELDVRVPILSKQARQELEEIPVTYGNTKRSLALLGFQACKRSGKMDQLCQSLFCRRSA